MDTLVFAAVLAAAFLHAAWNAALKLGLDRFSSVILLAVVQALIAIPILPFVTQPLWAAWPWILASVALHVGYKIFLINAYQYGDLSQVYPLARGSAPLLVAVVSGPVIGEPMSPTALAATFAILVHVWLYPWRSGLSSGKVTLVILLVLVASGIAWRIVYVTVPKRVPAAVGNLSVKDTRSRQQQIADLLQEGVGVVPGQGGAGVEAQRRRPFDGRPVHDAPGGVCGPVRAVRRQGHHQHHAGQGHQHQGFEHPHRQVELTPGPAVDAIGNVGQDLIQAV